MLFLKLINTTFRKPLRVLFISLPFLLLTSISVCIQVSDEGASAILVNGEYQVDPVERFITNKNFIYIVYFIPFLSLFTVLIYLLIDRFYLRALKYLVLYVAIIIIHAVTTIAFVIMISLPGPSTIVGNDFFYKQKFKEHTNIDLNFSVDIPCKTDTIIGVGPGGGDFSAYCVFTMDKEDVLAIENELKNDSISSIVNTSHSEFNEFDCSSFGEIDKVYQNNIRGDMESKISFSKDRTSISFQLYYW